MIAYEQYKLEVTRLLISRIKEQGKGKAVANLLLEALETTTNGKEALDMFITNAYEDELSVDEAARKVARDMADILEGIRRRGYYV